MPFGALVIGPPGSGKTTCCHGLSLFLRTCGREICAVNLDPAVESLAYPCDVDIRDLVSLDEVQEELALGPNGGLAYCFDYLEQNTDWLKEKLAPHMQANKYLLIDCPGQAELFMCHDSFKKVVQAFTSDWHVNLTALQLVDSHLCTTPHTYLSALLMCLTSMLQLELPYVNVLSKRDLLESMREDSSDHAIERLTDIEYLRHQLTADTSQFASRFGGVSTALCGVIDDFSLLRLYPLAIEDPQSVQQIMELVDQANGYSLSGLAGRNPYAAAISDVAHGSTRDLWAAEPAL